jgi:3-deoxy-D-manno-octulosonic-acid transferase
VIYFFYNFLWTIAYLILLPCIFFGKRDYFARKFALDIPERKRREKRIWIHALSVGEVLSTRPLIQAIKNSYPDKPIALTVKTSQGMRVARQEIANEVDDLFFMPLDYIGAIARIAETINPSIFILVETDIWPGTISWLKTRGIKIILVNGRVSPRTFRGYKKFRIYFRKILNDIDLLLMQSQLDSSRMETIGIPSGKIKTTGNIKFDQDWSPMDNVERDKWLKLLGLNTESKIFAAGSTHEGEEGPILKTYKRLLEQYPELVMIIAPRKLDRVKEIESMGKSMGLRITKRTELENNKGERYNVMILDTIGELGRIYGLALISFVGGSLVPDGGHNLLEPASFGCPVLFGKHTHNFVLMSELLLEHNGGKRIENPDDLYSALEELLASPDKAREMGKNARTFVQANSGAVNRIMDFIGGDIASS